MLYLQKALFIGLFEESLDKRGGGYGIIGISRNYYEA